MATRGSPPATTRTRRRRTRRRRRRRSTATTRRTTATAAAAATATELRPPGHACRRSSETDAWEKKCDMMMQGMVVYRLLLLYVMRVMSHRSLNVLHILWPHCTVLVIRTLIIFESMLSPLESPMAWCPVFPILLFLQSVCLSVQSPDGRIERRTMKNCGTGEGMRAFRSSKAPCAPLLGRQAHEIITETVERKKDSHAVVLHVQLSAFSSVQFHPFFSSFAVPTEFCLQVCSVFFIYSRNVLLGTQPMLR